MAKIDSNAELQEAITVLQSKQQEDLKRLKKEFTDVKERLKPSNLIKEGLSKVKHSKGLKTTLLVAGGLILSTIVYKKIKSRKKRKQHEKKVHYYTQNTTSKQGHVKKASNDLIRYIIASLLSQNADKIKDLIMRMINRAKNRPPQQVHSTAHTTVYDNSTTYDN